MSDVVMKMVSGEHLPYYGSEKAAGLDLHIYLDEPYVLEPGESVALETEISAQIPEGYFGMVVVRSGLGFKHLITLVNNVGIIDEDYRGNIGVKLINQGKEPYEFSDGERVAQMVLVPYIQPRLEFVTQEELDDTERGSNGFGSTGK